MKAGGEMEALLSVRNLKTYLYTNNREVKAVDGIDFDLYPKQIICIIGESGCGKSMTSLSILKLLPAGKGNKVSGNIRFMGRDLLHSTAKEMMNLRGRDISMIFQDPMASLNPVLTIGDQLCEPLLRHFGITRRLAEKRAVDMLRFVGIPRPEELIREYPFQLSGGMRQRVMIAMAMICRPKVLIADEPTTALDVTIQAQVLELMKEMRDEFDTSIILITHDFGVVAEMADHVLVMYAGQIVESADADTLFSSPLHPYTQNLLASIPTLTDDSQEKLYSIPGTVPNAGNYPEGCRFANRCGLAQPSCSQLMPELVQLHEGHLVRCDVIRSSLEGTA
jgi:peptide/nickel transport system ATP-binding protein/oligopeptide transport system ATP-binding protein